MIGRGKVDMILKYNLIGFDMDHTLVRYKLRKFTKLVCQSTSKYLINHKNYPSQIFPENIKDFKTLRSLFFRAVFDHKTGNLLKLGSNNLITRGYNGMDLLKKKEIVEIYGKNPLIENYHILYSKNKDFTNLHEFYGASLVPIIANCIHLKKSGNFDVLNHKSPKDIIDDIYEACDFNYGTEELTLENKTGYFFPEFIGNIDKYVNPISPDLLQKLQILRKKGIKVFIASNSSYKVADVIMNKVIGKNWIDYFDFAIYETKKPGFFSNKIYSDFTDTKGNIVNFENWMLEKEQKKEKQKKEKKLSNEKKKINFKELTSNKKKQKEDKILLNGHAEYLNQYIKKHIKNNYKVLFFGDTIVSDCVYCFDKNKNNWDIVLILEELQELENGLHRRDYINYWKFWGSALFDKNLYSGWEQTNIFEFADNVAHRTFSRLDSTECHEFLDID